MTLRSLLRLLKPKKDRSWQEFLEKKVEWWKEEEERARFMSEALNPDLVFWEASSRLPDGAIITADSGTAAS